MEVTQDKANDEYNNLKSLMNVDAAKKEILEIRAETMDNRFVNLEHECVEATEEMTLSLVVLCNYLLAKCVIQVCLDNNLQSLSTRVSHKR